MRLVLLFKKKRTFHFNKKVNLCKNPFLNGVRYIWGFSIHMCWPGLAQLDLMLSVITGLSVCVTLTDDFRVLTCMLEGDLIKAAT